MIFRLILVAFLIFVLYRVIKGLFFTPRVRIEEKRRTRLGSEEVMVKDPECGVYVPKREAIASMIDGESVYFCSKECLERYRMRDSKRS